MTLGKGCSAQYFHEAKCAARQPVYHQRCPLNCVPHTAALCGTAAAPRTRLSKSRCYVVHGHTLIFPHGVADKDNEKGK